MKSIYKRILLKISGEFLAGSDKTGIDPKISHELAKVIKEVSDHGTEVGIVVGGGNFWRGRSSGDMDRIRADHMGMLATVMNALSLSDSLEQIGVKTSVLTSIYFPQIGKQYSPQRAISHLEKGKVVIFGYGTGNAFFSTDTTAALRAAEIGAEVILKATTGADGVYAEDPNLNPNAKKYSSLTFDEMLSKNLKVVDSSAASICRDNNIPLLVFNINPPENILLALKENSLVGTLVTAK